MKEKKAIGFLVMCLMMLLVFSISSAAVPQTINYQGYLTDSGGTPIDGTVQMTFRIYNVDTGDTALWTETQGSVAVNQGVYSVVLGSVTPINLAFDTQYYLGVQVEADLEMTPRQALTSVPYAMNADTAELAIDVDDDVVTTTKIKDGAVTETKITDNAVTSAKIATGAVGSAEISDDSVASADVGFNYAGSSSKGGPASNLNCVGCVSQSELDFTAGDGHSLDAADGSPTDAVYVDNNGNVGIGTTSPGAKLDVDIGTGIGVGGAATIGSSGNTATGNYAIAMGFSTTASGYSSTAMGFSTTASGSYSTAMGYSTTASDESSTAMGLSTTASGYSSTAMGFYTTASGSYSTAMGYSTTASGYSSTAMGRGIEAQGSYSVAIALNAQNGVVVSQDNTMAIMGGNVGIGTTGPNNTLDVVGTLDVSSASYLNGIVLNNDADITGADRIVGHNDLRLYGDSNGGPDLFVRSNGNVGIGDTFPAYKLEIGGGDVNTTGGGYRDSGACVAGTCLSDRRLKRSIKPLSDSLEKIASLEPASFEFIDHRFGQGTQYGLVAQDVEKVFPEWVVTNDEGYKSIRYRLQIQMHLIQAVKELKAENENLRAKNQTLKQEIEKIKEAIGL